LSAQVEKAEVVEALRERLGRANIAILAEQKGLTVAQATKLRRRMRELSGEYKIAKNTLARRAIGGGAHAPLSPLLKGPTALVLGYEDPVAIAKEIVAYAALNSQQITIRGAVLDGQLFRREEVEQLAKLESKEQLRAKLLGVLNAPAGQLVRLLNEPGAQLARVLAAREEGAPQDAGAAVVKDTGGQDAEAKDAGTEPAAGPATE
jgi:large subunit ribosomal protein L10